MSQRGKHILFFVLLGALFYIPFLGGVHLFDWDEINFAEISREMIATGDYLRVYIDYQPFFQKPPLFFWFQVLAMKVFGIGEFAARLPNAICGIATLVLLYDIGRRLYDARFGILWAGSYFGSVLPFLYFKSGIIDPVFNFFIFLGLYFLVLFNWRKQGYTRIELPRSTWYYLFWSGIFLGFAILAKGPAAYLIIVLTMGVYWVFQRFRMYIGIGEFIFFSFSAALVTLVWFGLETYQNGPEFVVEFTRYQYRLFSTPDAGHAGFPGYHVVVLLVGVFPASVFAIRSFSALPEEPYDYRRDFRKWMKILFWVVLILFTVVRSKIVHYSSMCYFPITFLAATVLYRMLEGQISFKRWMSTALWLIGALYVLVCLLLPYLGQHPEMIQAILDDPFARANLEASVNWTGWEVVPGLWLLFVLIISIRLLHRNEKKRGLAVLFGGTAVFVFLALVFYIKRIEGYSQRAAVEFFEEKADEKCYIVTYGYKSYAHLYYAEKPPVENEKSYDREWLFRGDIDRPVYVVAKIHKAHELEEVTGLTRIREKNGFVFFRRQPD